MTPTEKEAIRAVIPHNYVVFGVSSNSVSPEIKLKSAEWAIITQIDGVKTMNEVAEKLSLSEDEALILFYSILQKELIVIKDIREPVQEYATTEFFQSLQNILVKIIGPVANYIIDDVLWDLNENQGKFLKDKIPLLTESISQEILDDDKRVQFQQEMLELIKKQ